MNDTGQHVATRILGGARQLDAQDLAWLEGLRMSKNGPSDGNANPAQNDPAEFEVEESFPASDPPGWTLGREEDGKPVEPRER